MKNMLKHSVRFLNRQKGYVIINILGLSIGIACSLIITLFIAYELSYDRFNEKKGRIYQLVLNYKLNGPEESISSNCVPIGPVMLREFPEVEDMCRINIWNKTVVKTKEQSFTEKAFILSDSTFFNIFSVKLIYGDKRTALNAPHKLVLSKSTAIKIFGKEDPMGKALQISTDTVLYTITGVMEDIPKTSHFDANIIGSFATSDRVNDNRWLFSSFNTYILLKPNANPKDIDAKLVKLVKEHAGADIKQGLGITFEEFFSKGKKYRVYLQPLIDIHLNSKVRQAVKAASDPEYLWIFGGFAILIIVMAAINFMNLSTAQSSRRAKEVGIKKVSGSSRGKLIGQFIFESIILSFLSLLIAVVIIKLSLPFFNNLLQSNLELNFFNSWVGIPALITIAILVGFLAGSYPAFYLSSFSPYAVLKGTFKNSTKNGMLRRVLVVLQFTISIMLIVGTTIMFHQINYMLDKNLGFNKEQLVVIERANAIGSRMKTFKESLGKIPDVVSVSASSTVPGRSKDRLAIRVEKQDDDTFVRPAWIDADFFKTYGLTLVSGRPFDEAYTTDKEGCIVNESAIKQFSIATPLTTRIVNPYSNPKTTSYLPIIGVVKNFHFESLRNEISPCLFLFGKDKDWNCISVKLSEKASGKTIKEIEKVWKEFTANDPMQYSFIDKDFEQMYKEEKQSANLAIIFTVLVIFIASLGLYGLTSFTVEQRTKEMGIRKAMGATVSSLFVLISKEIVLLVSISTLIAWPIVYYISKNWLQNYHYRINLPLFDFFLGFILAITIALITISYRTIKAARINPAESLRYE